ncbi:MAG: ABC transporter ATP-binding protein [Parachlamydiaceae bacterium]|nr:ABC transporter ATP-binding protein [Parachlamydiaceae bacterium]
MKNKPDSLFEKYHKEYLSIRIMDRVLIRRLLRYLYPYRWLVVLAVLFLIMAKAVEAVVPVFIGQTTQKIINGSDGTEEQHHQLMATVTSSGILLLVLLLISYVLDFSSMLIKNWVAQKALYTLRSEMYNHIQRLPLSYYDQSSTGRLMTRTIHDIDQISQMFSESVIPILGSLVLFLGMCIGIAWIDWRIAIVFALILPVVGWLTYRFQYYQRYCYDLVRIVVTAMNTFIQEHLMGVFTIRNFGLQERERRQFDELNEDNRLVNVETIHHFSYFIAGIDLLQNLSLIAVFVTLVTFAPPGTGFQVGIYFTFSLYAIMFFRPLADLAERYNILQSAMAAAERVFHLMDEPVEPVEVKQDLQISDIKSIEFDQVWFAYTQENWILKGLSFTLKKGESLALVGVSGEGKTTVINLLLRFYDFQKGSIRINGQDIREYPLHVVRKCFSVVLQDPVIFSGTIAENIGLHSTKVDAARMSEVVDYLNMDWLIAKFPEGLDHQLSARGQSLSVGEMQLLSIARAVAHERSGLILDEATANIDLQTEKTIQSALHKVLKNRTALVIAHRLSTIRHVTRIIVLHEGVVAEMGTHNELLEQQGIYEKLCRIHFKNI